MVGESRIVTWHDDRTVYKNEASNNDRMINKKFSYHNMYVVVLTCREEEERRKNR